MGKTLGLNDDYYHGIFPVIVYVIGIPAILIVYQDNLALGIHFLFDLFLLLSLIQFFYEWRQAVDPYVSIKYGDWIGFQENTKRDIKFFVIGTMLGIFVGFIVYAILANYVIVSTVNYITPEPASIPPGR